MKTRHRPLLPLLLFAIACAPLRAETAPATGTPAQHPQAHHGQHGGQFDPERRLARLTARLGLTTEQQAQLRPILAAQAEELKKLDATALTGDQRREKMRELRKADRAKIDAILTPEQRTKFAAKHPKVQHGQPNGQAGGPPPPPEDAD